MRRSSSTLILATGALAALVAALVGALALFDPGSRAPVDHSPIHRPSALDDMALERTALDGTARERTAFGDGDRPCTTELPRHLLVIGWDSADWDLLLPLLAEGSLPNLAGLMAEGSSGTLATFLPSVSPALWTTVATGVDPQRHGIHGFYARKPRIARLWDRLTRLGKVDRRLFSSSDRRARAIWNLLSEAERPVLVVGYHNTFPVEAVEGVMVSNYLTQDSIGRMMAVDVAADPELAKNLVDPPELLDLVLDLQREVDAALPEAARRFSGVAEEDVDALVAQGRKLPSEGDQRPWFLLHAYAFDEINARLAETLYPRIEPDLALVHFQSADWAAHQFLVFDRPDAYAGMDWSEATRRRLESLEPLYRDTVRAYYRYLDEWLGRLLTVRPPSTAVLVLSDHGTGIGSDPDTPGNHDHGPPGMIVLAGPGIRSGARIEGASLYDVMPTMAALLGLPLASDLPGEVLDQALCPGAWSARERPMVATYTPEPEFRPPATRPEALEKDLLEQLEALGYLDD